MHFKLKLIWCWCTFSWSCAVTSPPCPPGPPGGGLKPRKEFFFFRLDCQVIKSFLVQESLFVLLRVLIKCCSNLLKAIFFKFSVVYVTFCRKEEGERMKAWNYFQHSNYQAAYFNILAIYFKTYWEPWLRDPYSQFSNHPRLLQSRTEDWDNFKSHPLDE